MDLAKLYAKQTIDKRVHGDIYKLAGHCHMKLTAWTTSVDKLDALGLLFVGRLSKPII